MSDLRRQGLELTQEVTHEVDAVHRQIDDRRAARLGQVVAIARGRRILALLLGEQRTAAMHPADEAGVDQLLGDAHLGPEALIEANL